MKKMTNEKAKECIDAIIGTWEICQNQKYLSAVDVEIDAEDIVALKMAIEALEQQPCEDTISRQAVIDLSEKVRFECGSVSQMVSVSKIKELPSVTQQQKVGGWIPVSERLPEIGQYILCSLIKAKDVKHRVIICEYKREVWWSYVTAWMPLPQPYKGESEE